MSVAAPIAVRSEVARAKLVLRDRIVLLLLVFFFAADVGIDGYWLLHHDDLPQLTNSSAIARMYRDFSAADRGYYDRVSSVELALETINVLITPAVYVVLMIAIFREWPARYPIQLAVSSWVAYSVVLDFWIAHVGGYRNMPVRNTAHLAMFWGASSPWLLGHLYMATQAFAAISRQLRVRED